VTPFCKYVHPAEPSTRTGNNTARDSLSQPRLAPICHLHALNECTGSSGRHPTCLAEQSRLFGCAAPCQQPAGAGPFTCAGTARMRERGTAEMCGRFGKSVGGFAEPAVSVYMPWARRTEGCRENRASRRLAGSRPRASWTASGVGLLARPDARSRKNIRYHRPGRPGLLTREAGSGRPCRANVSCRSAPHCVMDNAELAAQSAPFDSEVILTL